MSAPPVVITFLGGLGEIGRNCACLQIDGRAILLDCGLEFADESTPGIDKVIPDFRYLREEVGEIEAVVATHGHEDHIGAIPELLDEFRAPIYGSAITLGLIRNRLEQNGLLDRTDLRTVLDGERHAVGPFEIEFLPITHSVPHGFASAIHTPHGVILHSGDFKLDLAPVDGRIPDLSRIGAIAAGEGVRVLLSDSTNAETPGWSVSETAIGERLDRLITDRPDQRVIVGTFASHLHRVQQVVSSAVRAGRTVFPLGRSMQRNLRLARDLGLITVADDQIRDIEEVDGFAPSDVLVVCTGSQAEPMSALPLMAAGESKWIRIGSGDTVILSSTPIPGNERRITGVINGLIDLGAEVVHSGIAQVHTTGHGQADELRTLLTVAQPEFFTPVHGEARHLQRHAEIALELGFADTQVIECRDGDQLVVSESGVERGDRYPAHAIWRHGIVADVDRGLLDERHRLGSDGFVGVVVVVDLAGRRQVAPPRVVTMGWLGSRYATELLDLLEDEIADVVDDVLSGNDVDYELVERRVRRAAGAWVNEHTRRRPPILPVIVAI